MSVRKVKPASLLLAALLGLGALPAMTMSAQAAQVSPAQQLGSKIKRVTVYSDRARVTREAPLILPSRARRYAITKLPGWVDDASVRVGLVPASAGRIIDVRVRRDFLARASDASYRRAEADLASTKAALAALNDELSVLDAQAKQIAAIKIFSAKKLSKDILARGVPVKTYGDVLRFISDSLRKTAAARRAVETKQRLLTPKLAAQQRRLTALRKLNRLEQTTVVFTLEGNGSATLKLTYMLPGATWEPLHELRTRGKNPKSAEVLSFARVSQASGEDWRDVEISFSTQSATEAIRIPVLAALTLGDTKRTTRIIRHRTSSFRRAQSAFRLQNKAWNEVNQKLRIRNFSKVYKDNFHSLNMIQSRTVQIFKTLRKRGTTAHFKSVRRASIRSDGQRMRIPIAKRRLAAKQKIVAAPEQSLNAARTLAMVNSSRQSLLPGKVALYHDSAFLGLTELGFVAPGESFSLFLNVADQLKLSRVLDRKFSSIVRKTRTRMKVAYIVTVENLAGSPVTLQLNDRIPVSENKAIRIDRVRITPRSAKPDHKGLLSWDLTLAPRQKRSFRIQYRIEYPPSLILKMERTRRHRRRPVRPGARRKQSISNDIMQLEQAL